MSIIGGTFLTGMKHTLLLHKKALWVAVLLIVFLVLLASFYLYSLTIPSSLLSTLPSVTKTKNGQTGDPITVALVGDKSKLLTAFNKAHWLIPDPINEATTIKIIKTSITNSPYPTAPVSNLYLFGRIQDLAFEYPTNTVRKRHHIRIWKADKLVSGQQVWVGAASFDSGLELSGTTHFPTHHIDPNVDAERNFLMQSLQHTGFIKNAQLQRITFPVMFGHNGNGDWYFDDGNAEIVTLKSILK